MLVLELLVSCTKQLVLNISTTAFFDLATYLVDVQSRMNDVRHHSKLMARMPRAFQVAEKYEQLTACDFVQSGLVEIAN